MHGKFPGSISIPAQKLGEAQWSTTDHNKRRQDCYLDASPSLNPSCSVHEPPSIGSHRAAWYTGIHFLLTATVEYLHL